MLLAGLVKVRELWFIGHGELSMLVDLVVQLQGRVAICKVLLSLLFDFVLGFNQQFRFFLFVFGLSNLEFFKGLVCRLDC